MTFLECTDCGETLRVLGSVLRRDSELALELERDERAFSERHTSCRLRRWAPCGEATTDLPASEPLATTTIPVRCEADPALRALARGAREQPDGPLGWRILPGHAAAGPRLDPGQLRSLVDLALERSDGATRDLSEWTLYLQAFAARLPLAGLAPAAPAAGPDAGRPEPRRRDDFEDRTAPDPVESGTLAGRELRTPPVQLALALGPPTRNRPAPARAVGAPASLDPLDPATAPAVG